MQVLERVNRLAHQSLSAMRLKWVHRCEDGFAVHLPSGMRVCPQCEATNDDHELSHEAQYGALQGV